MAKTRKVNMYTVLYHLRRGRSDKQICSYCKISTASLAAYKANLARQGWLDY